MPDANLHLTLAFLGEVEDARIGVLAQVAAAMQGSAFGLVLDRVGSFPKARVAWAGSRLPDGAMVEFQGRLARDLAQQGFGIEDRPFAPHLTLARKAGAALPPSAIAPIGWRVEDFALVRLRAGRYETLASWRLR